MLSIMCLSAINSNAIIRNNSNINTISNECVGWIISINSTDIVRINSLMV